MNLPKSLLLVTFVYFSFSESHAMDCKKAATVVEKAICANSELKTADHQLNYAYSICLDSTPVSEKDALKKMQKEWIAERDQCPVNKSELETCLKNKYKNQTELLFAKSLRETARVELFKNDDFKFTKVSLSSSSEPESCNADYIKIDVLNPKKQNIADELSKNSIFATPPKIECIDENTKARIDYTTTIETELLGKGAFLKATVDTMYINGVDQHGQSIRYFNLKTGKELEIKKLLLPNFKSQIKKTFLQDPETSKMISVADYFSNFPAGASYCEDQEMKYNIFPSGKIEIEVCPQPPMDTPKVTLDWKKVFVSDTTTQALFSK